MFVITVNTPEQAIREVVRYFQEENRRLEVRAGHATGRDKKDLLAQATYAKRQMDFWAAIDIQPLVHGK